jgi:tetratricopeptide (TPR) repeat protein
MRRRISPTRVLLAGLLFLLPAPALAVSEWYDFYLQARNRDIPAERWDTCEENVREALRLRPRPGVNVQTYGLRFLDYLPHHHLGLCLLRQEKYAEALAAFSAAEKAGMVGRSEARADFARLRAEAQNAEAARLTRRVRAELESLRKDAADLAGRRSWDEALALLVQAEVLARGLDTDTLEAITREQERLQEAQRAERDARTRAERIQQRLADGDRLMEEGNSTEAIVAYNEVLDLAPRNARALEGRRTAEERIRASRTRAQLEASLRRGRALFDAGRYEAALEPLTEAAVGLPEAGELLTRTRQFIEGERRQRDLRTQIEGFAAQGEALMKEGRFPEAQVAFENLLLLDPGHARASERLAEAERRTGEELLRRWFPNREPTLALFEPSEPVVESPTFVLRGVTSDDRGIERVEFRVGSQLVDTLVPDQDPVNPVRAQNFILELPLTPGRNEITVTAVDTGGLTHTITFSVERRLQFYESPLFLPAAGGIAVALLSLLLVGQRLRRRRAMRRRFNPYIAGAPVLDDDMYYGRQKLTARMLSTLHRNSLMITGERRIGKTTFLHHLSKVLSADEGGDWQFFPVFVDLQGVPERTFFHALMTEVVETLEVSPETRSSLRLTADSDRYEAREFSHDLKQVIEDLKTRTRRRVKLALLIDEVDVLNEYSESVNQRLRGIFMKSFSENLVAVMSGVGIRRRWKSEVSPWYNFFDEIEIEPFSREEAEALIREPVGGVFRWKSEAVEAILESSRLRPYLIQKYCVHAVNSMLENRRSTIRREDVEAARSVVELETTESESDPGATPDEGVAD